MSSTVAVPPPNSSSLLRRVPRLTGQVRAQLTEMNLHFAGVAALAVLDLYLLAHLAIVWQGLNARSAAAVDQQRVETRSAQLAARPLRGLDQKLVVSTQQANQFYQERLPYASSQVASELGVLTHREDVHWTRAQYAYDPVAEDDALTEMHVDASISGDYRRIVQFINAVERDRLLFVIVGINLTGQQNGQVNLRIRLITYLRAPLGQETVTGPSAEQGAGPAQSPVPSDVAGGAQ